MLKYTYVLGYYMAEGREKTLFEDLQAQLEGRTEALAELTERPPASMDRAEVVNQTRVTQGFLRELLQGVEEGLTGSGGVPLTAVARVPEEAAAPAAEDVEGSKPKKPSARSRGNGVRSRGALTATVARRRRGR